MYDFEYVALMLDDIVDKIPPELLNGLTGVYLCPETKPSPKIPDGTHYVMGEFIRNETGHSINIYFGSVMKVHGTLPHTDLADQLEKILRHELRHHVETLAGCDDLAREDDAYVKSALEKLDGPGK